MSSRAAAGWLPVRGNHATYSCILHHAQSDFALHLLGAEAGHALLDQKALHLPIALLHDENPGDVFLLAFVYQTIRTEIGIPSLVIRLRTLQPIFASVR